MEVIFLASVSIKGGNDYLYRLQKWVRLPDIGHHYSVSGVGLCPGVAVNHHADHEIPHITVDMHCTEKQWIILKASGEWKLNDAVGELTDRLESIAA